MELVRTFHLLHRFYLIGSDADDKIGHARNLFDQRRSIIQETHHFPALEASEAAAADKREEDEGEEDSE